MRAFISVDIPKNIQEEIKKIQEKIPEFRGKFTEPENLHLTLKFLGDVDDKALSEVKKRLKEIKIRSFETEIGSLGVFSPHFVRIIWLHMASCEELQKFVDETLSYLFEKEKRFMGHLTIARVKSIKNKKEFLERIRKISFPKIRFIVKDFRLKKTILGSPGPVYEILGKYPLEGRG